MKRLTIDRSASAWGELAVVLALALAVPGSGNLRWFDAALVGCLLGTVFAVFRSRVCLCRPATVRLNRRGWEAFGRPGKWARDALALPGLVVSIPVVRSFIRGLQILLLTVAVDALLTGGRGVTWSTAALSVLLAVGAGAFWRYLR